VDSQNCYGLFPLKIVDGCCFFFPQKQHFVYPNYLLIKKTFQKKVLGIAKYLVREYICPVELRKPAEERGKTNPASAIIF
jgi:hypothetical protein